MKFLTQKCPVDNLRALFCEDFRKGRQDIGEALKAGWRRQTHDPGGWHPGVSAAGGQTTTLQLLLPNRAMRICLSSPTAVGGKRGPYYSVPTARLGFPGSSLVKNLLSVQEPKETWVPSLGGEDPLEQEMATHSSTFAWRIPWTEKPGGYSPWGHRVRHDQTAYTHSNAASPNWSLQANLASKPVAPSTPAARDLGTGALTPPGLRHKEKLVLITAVLPKSGWHRSCTSAWSSVLLPLHQGFCSWVLFSAPVTLWDKWKSLSCVRPFETPWTIQSMAFSRPEYWSG